jgi:archaellum component FlaD/FlaE
VVAEAHKKRAPVDDAQQRRSGVVLRALSDDEKDARTRALHDSRLREADEREKAKVDAERRVVTDEQRAKEHDEAVERQRKEDARLEIEAEARRKGEEVARKQLREVDRLRWHAHSLAFIARICKTSNGFWRHTLHHATAACHARGHQILRISQEPLAGVHR